MVKDHLTEGFITSEWNENLAKGGSKRVHDDLRQGEEAWKNDKSEKEGKKGLKRDNAEKERPGEEAQEMLLLF